MSKRPRRVDVLVGRNIRMRRQQRGLTQAELGDHLGVTHQQIQKYESGANRVGASRLDQIAGALAVPLTALFHGQPTFNRQPTNGHADPDLHGGALLADPHALRLAQAFDMLPANRSRIAIMRLIETIGNGRSRDRRSGRGRRRLH
jgi:transcriptional regulator with XRE-family HTH domain